jgi:hypothetical protein
MAAGPVTALVVTLFVLIGGLISYGLRAFRQGDLETIGPDAVHRAADGRRVDMRGEVLWTATAATILATVFLLVRV